MQPACQCMPVSCERLRASLLLLQDGSMFKAQVEYAPYFYVHVKVCGVWGGGVLARGD